MNNQNTMSATKTETLAEFIESEAGSILLASAQCHVDDADCHNISSRLLGELERAAGDPDAEKSTLDDANDIAEALEDAARDIRNFITGYVTQSGAIANVEKATATFCQSPTTENRAALIKAARAVQGFKIAMPKSIARAFHPFVRMRLPANKIGFGNLWWLAHSYIREDMIVKKAA